MTSANIDQLMRPPLINWSSAIQRVRDQGSNSEIHKAAVATMDGFQHIMKHKEKSILEIQNKGTAKIVTESRKNLGSLVKTVLLFGGQNSPLHGNRDDSK